MEDGHGSVRVVVERPTPALRELDASARGLAGKRDVIRLEGVRRVRFSPVPADRQLLVEGESRGVGGDPSLPVLADPVVVSAAPGDGLRASYGILPRPNLLMSSQGELHPLCQTASFRLSAWRLSGIASAAREFRKRLSAFCLPHPARIQELPISQHGTYGVAGVFEEVEIPFRLT